MKISIDIDGSPEEMRTFFGLPDIKPMQDAVLDKVQSQIEKNLEHTDPEAIMKTWLTPGLEGFGEMQKMMWAATMGKAPDGTKDGD